MRQQLMISFSHLCACVGSGVAGSESGGWMCLQHKDLPSALSYAYDCECVCNNGPTNALDLALRCCFWVVGPLQHIASIAGGCNVAGLHASMLGCLIGVDCRTYEYEYVCVRNIHVYLCMCVVVATTTTITESITIKQNNSKLETTNKMVQQK